MPFSTTLNAYPPISSLKEQITLLILTKNKGYNKTNHNP